MTTIEQAIATIADFTRAQMDGQPVPPAASHESKALSDAVALVLKGTNRDHEILGVHLLSVVIDRVRSALETEGALHNITRGGGL